MAGLGADLGGGLKETPSMYVQNFIADTVQDDALTKEYVSRARVERASFLLTDSNDNVLLPRCLDAEGSTYSILSHIVDKGDQLLGFDEVKDTPSCYLQNFISEVVQDEDITKQYVEQSRIHRASFLLTDSNDNVLIPTVPDEDMDAAYSSELLASNAKDNDDNNSNNANHTNNTNNTTTGLLGFDEVKLKETPSMYAQHFIADAVNNDTMTNAYVQRGRVDRASFLVTDSNDNIMYPKPSATEEDEDNDGSVHLDTDEPEDDIVMTHSATMCGKGSAYFKRLSLGLGGETTTGVTAPTEVSDGEDKDAQRRTTVVLEDDFLGAWIPDENTTTQHIPATAVLEDASDNKPGWLGGEGRRVSKEPQMTITARNGSLSREPTLNRYDGKRRSTSGGRHSFFKHFISAWATDETTTEEYAEMVIRARENDSKIQQAKESAPELISHHPSLQDYVDNIISSVITMTSTQNAATILSGELPPKLVQKLKETTTVVDNIKEPPTSTSVKDTARNSEDPKRSTTPKLVKDSNRSSVAPASSKDVEPGSQNINKQSRLCTVV